MLNLNNLHNNVRVGCHVASTVANYFAYPDDLVLVAPSASALGELLRICKVFAADHYITHSKAKFVCLVSNPGGAVYTSGCIPVQLSAAVSRLL